MNETKRIDPSILDGKEPIAVGYKIFNYDWTGHGGYSYADENGNVEGSVHTVTGKLSKCGWGLHYCVNPVDCMKYRDTVSGQERLSPKSKCVTILRLMRKCRLN